MRQKRFIFVFLVIFMMAELLMLSGCQTRKADVLTQIVNQEVLITSEKNQMISVILNVKNGDQVMEISRDVELFAGRAFILRLTDFSDEYYFDDKAEIISVMANESILLTRKAMTITIFVTTPLAIIGVILIIHNIRRWNYEQNYIPQFYADCDDYD